MPCPLFKVLCRKKYFFRCWTKKNGGVSLGSHKKKNTISSSRLAKSINFDTNNKSNCFQYSVIRKKKKSANHSRIQFLSLSKTCHFPVHFQPNYNTTLDSQNYLITFRLLFSRLICKLHFITIELHVPVTDDMSCIIMQKKKTSLAF